MKIYNKIMLGLATVVALTSCNDYLDENISPNDPLIVDITPTQSLMAAQSDLFHVITGDTQNYAYSVRTQSLNQLGMIWTGTWSADAGNWTGAYTEEYTGDITTGFYNGIWDWTYLKTKNLQNIIDYNSENYDNHKAIAMILKSFYMQYIVDLYGDAPYSEAFQLNPINPTPAYDNQKDIYRALYDQLTNAIEMIDSADVTDLTVGGEDVMFSGNMDTWKRFANTLKLRFLIRQSEANDSEITSFVASEIANLANADFLVADATINPGYNTSSPEAQNPFYATYGYNQEGNAVRIRTLPVASSFIAGILNSDRTNDPRRNYWFKTGGDEVVIGAAQGDVGPNVPDGVSLIGPGIIPEDTQVGSVQNGYVIALSETKFLLAEAAQRFPSANFPSSSEQYFNEGVAASFNRFGLSSESLSSYMNGVSTLDGFGWSGSSDKIKAIVTQKWLALMFTNGMESYLDKLRTGYPQTDLPLINIAGGFPKRLMYPSSEVNGNITNVPTVTRADAYATGAFWVPSN